MSDTNGTTPTNNGGDGIDNDVANDAPPQDASSALMGLFEQPSEPNNNDNGKIVEDDQVTVTQGLLVSSRDGGGGGDRPQHRSTKSMSSAVTPLTSSFVRKMNRSGLEREQTQTRSNSKESSSMNETSVLLTDTQREAKTIRSSSSGGSGKYSSIQSSKKEERKQNKSTDANKNTVGTWCRSVVKETLQPSTLVGGFVFVLYHVVFCLALGSAIRRPHSTTSTLGVMSKMTAVGVIFGGPVFFLLSGEIPAIYPSVDLFLAPFLAKLAVTVDDYLYAQGGASTETFLATFCTLSGIGFGTASILIFMASEFKLANLGTYLPFPVLCGFFSAVGVSMWTLAFSVDNNGQTVAGVLFSGNAAMVGNALLHHIPSVCIALVMKWLGNRFPLAASSTVVVTIILFHLILLVTGTSLATAVKEGWFWSVDQLIPVTPVRTSIFDRLMPPSPFGWLNGVRLGDVNWGAVKAGLSETLTLSFLYLLRCTLQGAATRKNVSNLKQLVTSTEDAGPDQNTALLQSPRTKFHMRRLSAEDLDIESVATPPAPSRRGGNKTNKPVQEYVYAKPPDVTLSAIVRQYAICNAVNALAGSFGVIPSISAAGTMYSLGAGGLAPQILSILLLLIAYVTNFRFVLYVPKTVFSALTVLAAFDMLITWFYKSYQKTREKLEWFVCPIIVVVGCTIGLLPAVFVGITLSTFIFVAAFFRSGIVKFLATGLTVRSTIERSIDCTSWLNMYGDYVRILVLQNYLFFGNSSSLLGYIRSMFDAAEVEASLEYDVPPIPRFIVIDLTLVSGMDTSTVDIFIEMRDICARHDCKIFFAGSSTELRRTMSLAGLKPESGLRSKRKVRFFTDLDNALGKAEDCLLDERHVHDEDDGEDRLPYESGFEKALRKIDEQHGKDLAMDLVGFESYTSVIELEPKEHLYEVDGGVICQEERGLVFIESGIVRIEHDTTTNTLSRDNTAHPLDLRRHRTDDTLDGLHARAGPIAQNIALIRGQDTMNLTGSTFRLARIGPGWIVGATEGVGGDPVGNQIAVTKCKLHLLSFAKIQEAEEKDPKLALKLFKLLSFMMARREETTVAQLSTLHSIMTARAQKKPTSRLSTFSGHTPTKRHDSTQSDVSK